MKKVIILVLIIILSFSLFVGCDKQTTPSKGDKSKEAEAVLAYIAAADGNYVISGQQESTWMTPLDYEFEYIYQASGKYPAIRGLDYINDDFEGVNERAIEWWNKGGIVTICWHTGKNYTGGYNDCKDDVVDDWDKLLTEGTDEYNAMIAGIDKAAKALKELKDLNIPVLWRPYHEAYGDWFWWGKAEEGQDVVRAERYVKLWQIMYDRYTDYWKLDNLIWVLGYSHMTYEWERPKNPGKYADKWNPGAEYYDIIGADTYQAGLHVKLNTKIKSMNDGNKPTAYHECGENPTVEELQKTNWAYFMTWHTEYLVDRNTTESLNTLYNSDYIITLDELPNFKG